MLLLDLTPFIIGGSAGLALIIFLVVFFIVIKKKKPVEEKVEVDDSQWLLALGNKENINAVSVRGSRLSVELADDKKIDRELLTSLGVKSIITMSNKLILVIENNASLIAESINKQLQ